MDVKRFAQAREAFTELVESLKEALEQAGSSLDHEVAFERIHHAVDLRDTGKVMDAIAFLTDLNPTEGKVASGNVRAATVYLMDALSEGSPDTLQWIGLRQSIENARLAELSDKLDELKKRHARLRSERPVLKTELSPRTACDSNAYLDMLDRMGR